LLPGTVKGFTRNGGRISQILRDEPAKNRRKRRKMGQKRGLFFAIFDDKSRNMRPQVLKPSNLNSQHRKTPYMGLGVVHICRFI